MPRLFFSLVPFLLTPALATPIVVGGSVGVPRGGLLPATFTLTTPLTTARDLQIWARGDVTFALGSTLTPAAGLGVLLTPLNRADAFFPTLGFGATTVSSVGSVHVRPYALMGLESTWGRVGTRVEGVMVFTEHGPRPSAALGLTYRFDLGGRP